MNKKTKLILLLIGLLLLLLVLGFVFLHFHKKSHIIPTKEEKLPTEYQSAKLEDGSEIVNYGTCISKKEDEVCYLVINESMFTLRNGKVTKEDGDSTNIKESLNNGLNSAILVTYGSIGKIEDSVVSTNSIGATGFFVNGRKAEGELSNTEISTLKTNSAALTATNSGTIKGEHITLNTKVKDSPGLVVLKKDSKISVNKTMIETQGSGSPIFKTDGEIRITESTGVANGSRLGVINNEANVVIDNSSFIVSGGTNDDYPASALLIKGKNNVFQAINSSININQNLPYYKSAYLMVLDSTKTEIDLENTAFNIGSNKFMKAANSDIILNLKNQVLYGEFDLTKTKIQINLFANSSYTGTINSENVSIYLSKDSELNLTGDMYIQELKNDNSTNNNITTNGYHLYVNNELIK